MEVSSLRGIAKECFDSVHSLMQVCSNVCTNQCVGTTYSMSKLQSQLTPIFRSLIDVECWVLADMKNLSCRKSFP